MEEKSGQHKLTETQYISFVNYPELNAPLLMHKCGHVEQSFGYANETDTSISFNGTPKNHPLSQALPLPHKHWLHLTATRAAKASPSEQFRCIASVATR